MEKQNLEVTEIDLTEKTASECEDMVQQWSKKITEAENALQEVHKEHSDLRKRVIDITDMIRKGRDNIERLKRQRADIRSAMFSKLRGE